jgi:hypothetical protein
MAHKLSMLVAMMGGIVEVPGVNCGPAMRSLAVKAAGRARVGCLSTFVVGARVPQVQEIP